MKDTIFKRLFVVAAVLFLVAGCNGGGSTTGTDTSSDIILPPTTNETPTNVIGQIHNPEPASMLLWGIGLAGAALLRRKKR